MGLSAAEEIGKAVAKAINKSDDIVEGVLPNDVTDNLLLAPIDGAKVTLEVTGKKLLYASDSFIPDHPVYGDLDSSTLKLDGGYAGAGNVFPLEFPITFDEKEGSTIVFTYES